MQYSSALHHSPSLFFFLSPPQSCTRFFLLPYPPPSSCLILVSGTTTPILIFFFIPLYYRLTIHPSTPTLHPIPLKKEAKSLYSLSTCLLVCPPQPPLKKCKEQPDGEENELRDGRLWCLCLILSTTVRRQVFIYRQSRGEYAGERMSSCSRRKAV